MTETIALCRSAYPFSMRQVYVRVHCPCGSAEYHTRFRYIPVFHHQAGRFGKQRCLPRTSIRLCRISKILNSLKPPALTASSLCNASCPISCSITIRSITGCRSSFMKIKRLRIKTLYAPRCFLKANGDNFYAQFLCDSMRISCAKVICQPIRLSDNL